MKITRFQDIPNALKEKILKLGLDDVEKWVQSEIPDLDNQSVVSVLNQPNGEEKIRLMLDRIGEFYTYE